MEAQTYRIRIEGETPLLMHQDNLVFGEKLKKWQNDPANKGKSVAGDDRTPAWTWIGYMYEDGGKIALPSDNLMTMLREGGAKCPTGKRGATFKRQTQSGLVVDQAAWSMLVNGKTVDSSIFTDDLIGVEDFPSHEATAEDAGFMLFVKRARIGQAKHVRVRPRFDVWAAEGSITVFDQDITADTLQMILTYAGRYAGLGDWRPSSPRSPGPYGKFTAKIL